MIHRVTLSTQELTALCDRLVPISPSDYTLEISAILRDLYVRFDHILFNEKTPSKKEAEL
ncbi:hypothetical protein ES708_33608 [subsurface metagenome]